MSLTRKEKLFCKEYLIDKNAAQAAIRTGYSERSAKEIGYELLTKPHITAQIEREIEKQARRIEITADNVIKELAKLAFSNMEDYITVRDDGYAYVDLSMLTREEAAALSELTVDEYVDGKGKAAREVKKVKIKLVDKKGSLELLAKHFNLLIDKVEHSGKLHLDFLNDAIGKAKNVNDGK